MKKLLVFALIAAAAIVLTGCFSLGVSDEDAYLAKFSNVVVLNEDYGKKEYPLSKFIEGDEFRETFSAANYRFLAIGAKETLTVDEMGAYLYLPASEAARDLTVNYYVADELPKKKEPQEDETISYDVGLSEGTVEIYEKTIRLAPGKWNDLYVKFPLTEIPEGSYFMLGFSENNDAAFSADEGAYVVKKQNDVRITADKLLLHIRS